MKQLKLVVLSVIFCSYTLVSSGQWITKSTGKAKVIYDIYMVNSTVAYATGDSLFLKTTNGGDSWTDLTKNITLTDPNFTTVFFIDANTGFIGRTNITGGLTLLKTTNGGDSWINISSPQMSQGIANLFFTSSSTGYATGGVGGGNIFATSTNGGAKWNEVTSPSSDVSMAIFFTDDLTGFSGTDRVMKTTNGGTAWNPTNMPSDEENPIVDIVFLNSQTGYALTYKHDIVFKTTDGGNNWTAYNTGVTGGLGTNIAFTDATTGYIGALAVLPQPLITTNGGQVWTADSTFPAGKQMGCLAAKNGVVMVGTINGEIIIKKSGTAQVQNPQTGEYKIYPNPLNSGTLMIDNPSAQPLKLSIYNTLGQLVETRRDITTTVQLDLAPAVYYCRIADAAGKTSIIKLSVK